MLKQVAFKSILFLFFDYFVNIFPYPLRLNLTWREGGKVRLSRLGSPIEAPLSIVLSSVSSAFHVTYYIIGLHYYSIFWKNLNFLKVGSVKSTMESAFSEG